MIAEEEDDGEVKLLLLHFYVTHHKADPKLLMITL